MNRSKVITTTLRFRYENEPNFFEDKEIHKLLSPDKDSIKKVYDFIQPKFAEKQIEENTNKKIHHEDILKTEKNIRHNNRLTKNKTTKLTDIELLQTENIMDELNDESISDYYKILLLNEFNNRLDEREKAINSNININESKARKKTPNIQRNK